MAHALDRMHQATDYAMEAMFAAVRDDDYLSMLALIKNPSFDINQASTGERFLHQTPLSFAIHFKKVELVRLFLAMGANPYGCFKSTNPIHLIDFGTGRPEDNDAMRELLLTHQQQVSPNQAQPLQAYPNNTSDFINAVRQGKSNEVKAILMSGLIYTDQHCTDKRQTDKKTAFALAVESGCVETVKTLLEWGAGITNAHVRWHLHNHKNHASTPIVTTLIQEAKQKQYNIMAQFIEAENSCYRIMKRLLNEADRKKRAFAYHVSPHSRVTRFFEKGEKHLPKTTFSYPNMPSQAQHNPNQPTMFTPWGKILSSHATQRRVDTAPSTFTGALTSIFAQLCVDVFGLLSNAIILIPNLMLALYYALYSLYEMDDIKRYQYTVAAKEHLVAPILVPYFALSIVVDLLRECTAILTRTYATYMQTEEEASNPYFTMG